MLKIAIVIFSDTVSIESFGKVSNAFMFANELIDNGDEPKIIFEGAGAKWVGELEKTDHKFHSLYMDIKQNITGVCSACAQAFGVKSQIEKAGLKFISEYKNHPSMRSLIDKGYQVIIF